MPRAMPAELRRSEIFGSDGLPAIGLRAVRVASCRRRGPVALAGALLIAFIGFFR